MKPHPHKPRVGRPAHDEEGSFDCVPRPFVRKQDEWEKDGRGTPLRMTWWRIFLELGHRQVRIAIDRIF